MENINFSPAVPLIYSPIWEENKPRKFIDEKKNQILKSLGIEPLNVINEYVLQSGRISGKTTECREYILYRLMTVEGANAVVTRADQIDIRNTVFNGFVSLINKITNNHPYDWFSIKYSPFSIKFKPNGNMIYFLAINGDINRSKGFELTKGYLDVVWHEECNENDKADFIEASNMTFLRFFKKCSKIFYAFNTEPIRNHWSNIHFKQKIKAGEAMRVYATWKDIYKFLDSSTIQKILDDRARNIDYYRYWYLGHLVNLTGLVFPQFNRKRHIVQVDTNVIAYQFASFIISIDAANKNDATAAILLGVLTDGRLLALDCFYYEPLGREGQRDIGQKNDLEICELICKWWSECLTRYKGLNRITNGYGIVDNANWSLMSLLQQSATLNYVFWQPATDKNILRDTKRLQNMLGKDLILFNVAPYNDIHCGIEEIESYVYDEDTLDIARNQKDHFIDSLKYGTYAYNYPAIYKQNC